MRLRSAALLTCAWLAGIGTAFGQTVDRGTEVTVNPIAGGGNGVLLYPGGQYMRVIHPALQPGESAKDTGAIQLHMPTKRATVARKVPARTVARAEPPAAALAAPLAAPEPPSKPEPKPKAEPKKPPAKAPHAAVASAAPPPSASYNPGFGNFDQGAAGLLGNLQGPPPAAQPAPPPPQPTRVARANPPPASAAPSEPKEAPTPGLSKRSVILFAPQASDPAES